MRYVHDNTLRREKPPNSAQRQTPKSCDKKGSHCGPIHQPNRGQFNYSYYPEGEYLLRGGQVVDPEVDGPMAMMNAGLGGGKATAVKHTSAKI